MPRVWLTYSDGIYSIRDLGDPKELEAQCVVYIPDHLYRAIHQHSDVGMVLQDALRAIDNERNREE